MKRSTVLRTAITDRRAVVVPGCHDALSARLIEQAGFEAIQVSGFGLAGCLLGKPDVGLVQMKDVLDFTANIVHAVKVPVMADVDTGGGNAVNAAWTTERVIEMGAAGLNIEDQVFPKRCGHMAGKEVIPADEMVGKIRACAKVRDALDKDFIINARTDCFAAMGLDEAVRRCNMYLDAGADLVFIDAIKTRADIEAAVKAIRRPALRQPHGWRERCEDRAHPDPRIGKDRGRARLHPRRLHHGGIQGAQRVLCRAPPVAHGHASWPNAVGAVVRGVYGFRRAEGISRA